ncbi:MAG: hypothetical protein ACXAEX_18085 [Promethearchaeota archaeon]|jgi:uncharacterized protein YsxB (DUF464 family)
MDSIIYKVIFKAKKQFEDKNLSLSFKDINTEKPIVIPPKIILELKTLSENDNNVAYFQNIEEVIIVGNIKTNFTYNYYLIFLFTIKSKNKKQGYLIGNVKNIGDVIIGVWPFNLQHTQLTLETILESYDDIIKNPNKYSKICLISQ